MFHQVLLGGDQLTVVRVRSCQMRRGLCCEQAEWLITHCRRLAFRSRSSNCKWLGTTIQLAAKAIGRSSAALLVWPQHHRSILVQGSWSHSEWNSNNVTRLDKSIAHSLDWGTPLWWKKSLLIWSLNNIHVHNHIWHCCMLMTVFHRRCNNNITDVAQEVMLHMQYIILP